MKAKRKSLNFPVHHSDFPRRILGRLISGPEMFLCHQVMDGNQNRSLRRGLTSNLMTGNRLMTCFTHMFNIFCSWIVGSFNFYNVHSRSVPQFFPVKHV